MVMISNGLKKFFTSTSQVMDSVLVDCYCAVVQSSAFKYRLIDLNICQKTDNLRKVQSSKSLMVLCKVEFFVVNNLFKSP